MVEFTGGQKESWAEVEVGCDRSIQLTLLLAVATVHKLGAWRNMGKGDAIVPQYTVFSIHICYDVVLSLTALGPVCYGRHVDYQVRVSDTGWTTTGHSAIVMCT